MLKPVVNNKNACFPYSFASIKSLVFIVLSLTDPTMFKLVTLPDQNTLELILFPTMHSVPLSAAASDSHASADLLTVKAAVYECSM